MPFWVAAEKSAARDVSLRYRTYLARVSSWAHGVGTVMKTRGSLKKGASECSSVHRA